MSRLRRSGLQFVSESSRLESSLGFGGSQVKFFFLPFLALILCSPIDGVASNIFSFFLLYMETLDHPNFSVWLHFFLTYHLIPRGRNHLNIAKVAFADGGNRTQAACTASECAIHYSIASRHSTRFLILEIDLSSNMYF